MSLKAARLVTTPFRHWLNQVTEPHILFPAIAFIVLAIIWGTTLNLIRSERIAARNAAGALNHQLAETYESQVVRALREIDQTLKIVKYEADLWGIQNVLPKLEARDLLPPSLVFTISITDSKGDIVVSNGSFDRSNVADQDYFQSQLQTDTFSVGRALSGPVSGASQLHFSRRLGEADEQFSGIVIISVDATYFVSSYDSTFMGEHGLLGIFGIDGVFRIRRSGEAVSAGDRIDYTEAILYSGDEKEGEGRTFVDPLDKVLRYIHVYEFFGFPLASIVGLSVDEQLAATRSNMYTYLRRAAAASGLLILIIASLGYMRWQLLLNRRQMIEVQRVQAEHDQYLAYHDGLTTLPNRSLFSKILDQGIQLAHRYNRQLAVLFLDLDRFKHINDTLGHEAGDQLLQEVAIRLKACLRDSDTVARLGGDEFVVLLPQLDEEKYAATVATKILTAVARPFILGGAEYRITASVGISIYPQDGADELTLTKNADVAMYYAKEEGKNNFKFYSAKLNVSSLERLTLEEGLRHALKHNELRLHYQAKRDTRSGRITGMEALLRWQHPDLGMVAPMQFLPVAEETGLILPIGKWVIKTACRQNMDWQKQGLPHVSMAVNLSPRQFEDETLLPDLTAILSETGMDARLLELEISEVLLMRDIEKKLHVLNGLKKLGVRIAIDDFGSGYASLTALRQFPLDTIKIDRSFILNITSIAEDRAMAEAILALGHALNMTVVAQGVETKQQAEVLRQQNSGEFQGFYLNRPMPADEITELLQTQAADVNSDAPLAV